ncbi:hypothetical protein AYI85_12910 [Shewanella algae]|nr:hypothetical protein AYI85_12910 [Shewanella algae]TVL05307.1 hypothetical protein AYI84_04770 [Shewanella algae]TVL53270.1 hypothetical protein AYI99_06720 [Shewanella algae]
MAAEYENPPSRSGKFYQLVAVMMNKTQETKERFNWEYSGWPRLFLFFTVFGIKSHNSRCASSLKSWSKCIHAQWPVRPFEPIGNNASDGSKGGVGAIL